MTSTTLSALVAPLAANMPLPAMVNAQDMAVKGFADVSALGLDAITLKFTEWLVSSSAACGSPIDSEQAVKFLVHMIRNMGLGQQDLVYMKIFISRYQAAFQKESSSSSSSSSTTSGQDMTSFGLQLLLAAYNAQALMYDEPLAKDTWLMYSRMPWSDFLDQLFAFNSVFDFNIDVSVEQWNTACWSLAPEVYSPPPPSPTRLRLRLSSASGTTTAAAAASSESGKISGGVHKAGKKGASSSSAAGNKVKMTLAVSALNGDASVVAVSHSPRVPLYQ